MPHAHFVHGLNTYFLIVLFETELMAIVEIVAPRDGFICFISLIGIYYRASYTGPSRGHRRDLLFIGAAVHHSVPERPEVPIAVS